MQEHADALDYDCMTRTGRTLGEYADMGARGLVALSHLVRHLPQDSATWRAAHEGDEMPLWSTPAMTNALLADISDQIDLFRSEHAAKGTGRRPRRMKPRHRPWAREGGGIGRRADVRAADFDEWWRSR